MRDGHGGRARDCHGGGRVTVTEEACVARDGHGGRARVGHGGGSWKQHA